jgi:hypothetical protein
MREMLALDPDTQNRLLAGRVAPEDAPPGYGDVAAFVRELARPAPVGERGRETETVSGMARMIRDQRSFRAHRRRPRRRAGTRLVALAIGVSSLGTAGAAFAGVLPDPAQDLASRVLRSIGLHVTRSDSGASGPRSRRELPAPTPTPSVTMQETGGASVTEVPPSGAATVHGREDGPGTDRRALDGVSPEDPGMDPPLSSVDEPVATEEGSGDVTGEPTETDTDGVGRSAGGSESSTPPITPGQTIQTSPPDGTPSPAATYTSPPAGP